MSDAILLTITDTVRRKMLSYPKSGYEVIFSHVSLGGGNYQHSKETPELAMPWGDFPIIHGTVNKDSHCLSLSILGRLNTEKTVSEIGLYDSDGQLFAVASKIEGYYFKTQPGVYFGFNISVTLDQEISGQKIKLGFSPQDQLLSALITLHGEHSNPHPQYIKFMRNLIDAHLLEVDPHNQYAKKLDAQQAIQAYMDRVNKLILLYLFVLKALSFLGSFAAGSINDIELKQFKGNLANPYPILLTPEGVHEGWSIARSVSKFTASIFSRTGTTRGAYSGRLNWFVLPVVSEAPAAKIALPELIDSGVLNSTGTVNVSKKSDSTADYNNAVFLMCPEGAHEGWSVERSSGGFKASVYNRSVTSRIGYNGNVSYAVLDQKKNAAMPAQFPGLLMSGVSESGRFSITRPIDAKWNLTKSNYMLLITPEGPHEAWDVVRSADKINVFVYDRSGQGRADYTGRVNWAIFVTESE